MADVCKHCLSSERNYSYDENGNAIECYCGFCGLDLTVKGNLTKMVKPWDRLHITRITKHNR